MKRLTLTALLTALALPVAASQAPMREHLKQELPTWGYSDVDVDGLTRAQVVHINHLLHSNKSPAQIRGNIGAILGDSLLKTLFGRQ
ncbi:hypothetical protein BDE40_2718 [Litoreibacter halocynthiae]|uniref:YpeB-like protein with protease inhibitory function n=1 Tax=Litoreibacter halocynthiae TaxID=1242689 RepID=A0A4R7LFK6_9RHOB|nr:hypothetical protein [Litoreibacter halocynthiae]TDT73939.1 hypothetical protein BDE40_2718 [Litoreibacter halocynthiae]